MRFKMSENSNVTMNPVRANVTGVSKDGRTAKVEIPTIVAHGKYGKRLQRVTRLSVDTSAVAGVVAGVSVSILPCRRISKTKSWKILAVVS
jgi:ribosomal protein S17